MRAPPDRTDEDEPDIFEQIYQEHAPALHGLAESDNPAAPLAEVVIDEVESAPESGEAPPATEQECVYCDAPIESYPAHLPACPAVDVDE